MMEKLSIFIDNIDDILESLEKTEKCWSEFLKIDSSGMRDKYSSEFNKYLTDCRVMRGKLAACLGVSVPYTESDFTPNLRDFHIEEYFAGLIFSEDGRVLNEVLLCGDRCKAYLAMNSFLNDCIGTVEKNLIANKKAWVECRAEMSKDVADGLKEILLILTTQSAKFSSATVAEMNSLLVEVYKLYN